jgi:hypothetical protein
MLKLGSHHRPTLTEVRVGIPLLPLLRKIGTPTVQRFLVERIPSKAVQALTGLVDTLQQTAKMMFDSHSKKLKSESANDDRNMMSLLCECVCYPLIISTKYGRNIINSRS